MAWPSDLARISAGRLWAPNGVLSAKSIALNDVSRITAETRDARTHDEILLHFSDSEGTGVCISEFDAGFGEVMLALEPRFPGLADYRVLNRFPAFSPHSVELWPSRERSPDAEA